MALAHHILVVIFHLIRDGEHYKEPGADFYDQKRKPRLTRTLVQRLERLGYHVTLEVVSPPAEEISKEPEALIT